MLRPIPMAHVDLDGAWPQGILARHVDARGWGPKLRYSATPELLDSFYADIRENLGHFTLFGSGDFHHLSAVWLRGLEAPTTLISFDNHPDWDVRPPDWGCGGWINRALELPNVSRAAVWGCGNFELNWPHRLFGNQVALAAGRLEVHPWAERIGRSARKRWPGLAREHWRARFSQFAKTLAGERVYVTVDLDCLQKGEAVTNWESGLFTASDIAWALHDLHGAGAEIVGGDLCGAWSRPRHARFKQWLSSYLDHPRQPAVDPTEAARVNERAMRIIWRALTAGYEEHAGADEQYAHP